MTYACTVKRRDEPVWFVSCGFGRSSLAPALRQAAHTPHTLYTSLPYCSTKNYLHQECCSSHGATGDVFHVCVRCSIIPLPNPPLEAAAQTVSPVANRLQTNKKTCTVNEVPHTRTTVYHPSVQCSCQRELAPVSLPPPRHACFSTPVRLSQSSTKRRTVTSDHSTNKESSLTFLSQNVIASGIVYSTCTPKPT